MYSVFKRGIARTPVLFRRRVVGPSGHSEVTPGGYRFYKAVALLIFFPIIGALMANAYFGQLEKEHAERPPFVPYEYMYRRTKRFPWGEGQRSLFHNPHTNALPDGYEEVEDEH